MNNNSFKIKLINCLAGLVGFSQALLVYIASSYFKEASGREDVSIFYLVSYLVVFLVLLNFHKLVKIFGKSIILYIAIMGEITTIAVLLFSDNAWLSLSALIANLIFESIVNVCLDIMLETFSQDNNSGRIRGSFLTILNVGFIAGPLLSTSILSRYDFSGIFLTLLIMKSIYLAIAFWGLNNINHDYNGHTTIRGLFKKVWRRKNILRIYYVSFALEFFYALMIIYSPIYLRGIGISWEDIGFMFTIMLIPFLFFEYPLGWLADKKWGEKEMIIYFLCWISISTLMVYLIDTKEILIWTALLLSTRIGAASIQILRDSYFYKKINKEDIDLINFFRTAAPAGYVVGSIFSVIIINYFSVKEVFLLIAIMTCSALWPAFSLRDNLSEADKKLQRVLV